MSDSQSQYGPERFLRVDHLDRDLRGRSARGGAVTIANQGGKFLLTLGSTAILARLLTPEDFGLIAMVVVVVSFIATFKDMGLSMATVQRVEVNHGQVSTLFWVNVALSLGVMGVTAALGPVLAWFYKEPRLVKVTAVLATTIVFSGLTVQHQALLRRQMRFGVLAVIEITSMAIGLACAVIAAIRGLGYWSLVIMPIVREGCITAGVWIACRWRPGKPVRRSGVRHMLSFGAHLTGFNIVNYIARNLDKMLIGWQFGASVLGLYNKAYQLLLLPIQQINVPLTTVAVPALSRLQDQLERYRAYYIRGVLLTVAAGMPIVTFLFVDAELAILTVLGDQWQGSVDFFRVLGPAAFIGSFNVATGWVYISLGRTRRQFVWGIIGSAFTVTAYAVGMRWGASGVAGALSASFVILRIPSIVYCFSGTHLRMRDLVEAIWRPTVASLGAGAALFWLLPVIGVTSSRVGQLAIDFVLYVILYILLWVVLPGGLQSARDIIRIVGDLRASSPTGDDAREAAGA